MKPLLAHLLVGLVVLILLGVFALAGYLLALLAVKLFGMPVL